MCRSGPGRALTLVDTATDEQTFDTQESWAAYGAHPAHVAVVEQHVKPVLASKVFIQTTGPDFLA